MKKLFKVWIMLLLSSINVVAQTSFKQNSIAVIYTYEGNVYNGFCEDVKKMPIELQEFCLGNIKIPEVQIRSIEIYELNAILKVKLTDSRVISGSLKQILPDSIKVQHVTLGTIGIPLNSIASIKEGRAELPGKWNADPNCTRYFFAPSSFMLRKGEGYYQNAYILSNSVNYGISDHFTIGGGVILPILFYVTPKVGYTLNEYLHVSAGVFAGGTYLNSGIGAGIGYGLITIGTRDYHFTAGAGFGSVYQNNTWSNTERPIVTLSVNTRLTRRLSLVSENWLFQLPFDKQVEKTDTLNGVVSTYMEFAGTVKTQVAIGTLGGRFVWEKLTLDLGILAPINFQDVNLVLPYIDLAVKF